MQTTIRPFLPRDTEGVQSLVISVQHEHGVQISLQDQPDLFDIPKIYQVGAGNFWVAVDKQESVVGTMALIDIGDGAVAMRKVFLKPDQRGSGLARDMLAVVFDWMKEHASHTVCLGTISRLNVAIRFYEKNGFSRVDKSQLPASFPVMHTDDLFLMKTV
ncbi:N-acetyltransferase GCN5 [Chytriomyces sp. MP71]|nr:N-acetyltransferase GCN5 [Chytriomyces sp. MP71]